MPRLRTTVVAAVLAATGAFPFAGSALAEPDRFDCSDFESTQDATGALLPEDPSNIDKDGDGTACEGLPGTVDDDESAGHPSTDAGDVASESDRDPFDETAEGGGLDCSDFESTEDATGALLPEDPFKLDPDGDGTACEALPGTVNDDGGGPEGTDAGEVTGEEQPFEADRGEAAEQTLVEQALAVVHGGDE